MAEITLTVKQIVNLGLWSKVCEYKGWEYLSVDRCDPNKEITFDDTFEKSEKEEEIELNEAIEIIRNDGTVKVIYRDDKVEYIDQFDVLDGVSFGDLFIARFYKDCE